LLPEGIGDTPKIPCLGPYNLTGEILKNSSQPRVNIIYLKAEGRLFKPRKYRIYSQTSVYMKSI
jgi:hypothetical protein